MKIINRIVLLSGFVVLCFAFNYKEKKQESGSKGFALIELFSSEGCSSCPPAEAVMHKLIQKTEKESLPVYIIEFHVDYWDYLGWKDTFALPEYSKRQKKYGDLLKLNSIYTPQAIINGETEMVGSDEEQINSTIAKELQKPSSVTVECKAHKINNSQIELTYTVNGNISGCELNIAVVESDLTSYIKKGENARKTLTHDNVARVFKTIELESSTGRLAIDIPHVNTSNSKLICYVQKKESMGIIGAKQATIVQ
jgi:hypothetical protein